MLNRIKREYVFEICIFALLWFFLFLFTAGMNFYIDDYVFSHRLAPGSAWEFYKNYLYGYGLHRPFALVYWFGLFFLQKIHLFIPYAITIAVHIASGWLLYRILKPYYDKLSLLIGVLYIFFPLFTEQYAWITGSVSAVANFVFLIQVWIAGRRKLSLLKKTVFILLLQSAMILFYESIFFTFIPLWWLIIKQGDKKATNQWSSALLLLFALPSVLYYMTRVFIFPAHSSITQRELGIGVISRAGLLQIFSNITGFANAFLVLFVNPYTIKEFWMKNIVKGFFEIIGNIQAFVSSIVLVVLLQRFVYQLKKNSTLLKINCAKHLWIFFAFSAFFMLLPSFFIKAPTYPFRIIGSVYFFLLLALFLYVIELHRAMHNILEKIIFALIIVFALSSAHILLQMRAQTSYDKSAIQVIAQETEAKNSKRVVIVDHPNSTQTNIVYGEYLGSCLSKDWCLKEALIPRVHRKINVLLTMRTDYMSVAGDAVFRFDPKTRQIRVINIQQPCVVVNPKDNIAVSLNPNKWHIILFWDVNKEIRKVYLSKGKGISVTANKEKGLRAWVCQTKHIAEVEMRRL